jgi:hypothetical protein
MTTKNDKEKAKAQAEAVKLAELKKACDEKGIAYTESATIKDLAKLLKDEKPKGEKASDAVEKSDGEVEYIWLKIKAYVSDKERLLAGFYVTPKGQFPRLKKIATRHCEIFTDAIPHKKLYDIAKWAGLNVDNFTGSDEELIEKLQTVPKPYL